MQAVTIHPYGDPKSQKWRDDILSRHFPLKTELMANYRQVAAHQSYQNANGQLRRIDQRLMRADLNLSWDDQRIANFCGRLAQTVKTTVAHLPIDQAETYCRKVCATYGLTFPEPQQADFFEPSVGRVSCPRWWRRQVRTLQGRELDQIARDMRTVSRFDQIYCGDWTMTRRNQQKKRNRDLLEAMTATNEDGQQYTLQELADLSTSKPSNRRNELMVRMRGFEEVATARGHAGLFVTVTCPSKFHLYSGDQANKSYQGDPVRAGSEHLSNCWARLRAWLKRHYVGVYGFRVAEPHHDGAPHWHLMLFCEPGDLAQIKDGFTHYFLTQHSPGEPGARKYRVKFVDIDPAKGTAAGYIAKYISKNIDGAYLDADLYGRDAKQSARRIDAWAGCHGIRQFQQIGGPSVTVWRELRRLSGEESGELGELVRAADSADWAAYVELMGGPLVGREAQPVRPAKWVEFDPETGAFIDPVKTCYGDENPGQVFGVIHNGIYHLTRFYRWTVERIQEVSEKVIETVSMDDWAEWCGLTQSVDPPGFDLAAA